MKEFLCEAKPDIEFSSECCELSKKRPMREFAREINADLEITGERKSEGGIRATSHSSCFEEKAGADKYMPLFFWNNETKEYYKETEGIVYSDCYEVYGLKRTGCAGCPFALGIKEELSIMKKYEPNLHKACVNIFGDSYRLTRDYRKYAKMQRKRRAENEQDG